MKKERRLIIDFHTHAFPDEIAQRALNAIEHAGGIKPNFDGTLKGLLNSMEDAGVSISVVLSIATKPSQFDSILRWSSSILSEKIIPFPSVHPDDKQAREHILQIKEEGFKGIKMHPYFQNFYVDEERMFPIYEVITEAGLILVMHSGYDFAWERVDRAGPHRILKVIENFPELKLVAAHSGGWEQWDMVEELLIGKRIFIETSFSSSFLKEEQFERLILKHSSDMVLFGTDTPWANQKKALQQFNNSGIPDNIRRKILGENAAKLLGIL